MLGVLDDTVRRLDESARVQRRLVADASHELRTPVTSLRTNIEVLERADELPPRGALAADRRRRRAARGALDADQRPDRARARGRARRHPRGRPLRHPRRRGDRARPPARAAARASRPTSSRRSSAASPARLDRAVNNLLDNAVKFAGTDEPIEVRLHDGELEVRDHGPGIAADDLPHVFDRFFRGARSRALPGSGLGLAIVRQVAELHAGSVSAAPAPGGGTVMRMRVPVEAWS